MLPSKELKFQVSNLKYRVIKSKVALCGHCKDVYTALKDNAVENLKRLRIKKPQYCYCSPTGEVAIEILRRPNRNASFKKVGTLTLFPINKTTYETHSYLNSSLRSKRIGLWMYCLGADWCKINNFQLKSSDGYSKEAECLWRSNTLRKYYNVTGGGRRGYSCNRFTVSPKRATKMAKFPKSSLLSRGNHIPLVARLLTKSQ